MKISDERWLKINALFKPWQVRQLAKNVKETEESFINHAKEQGVTVEESQEFLYDRWLIEHSL